MYIVQYIDTKETKIALSMKTWIHDTPNYTTEMYDAIRLEKTLMYSSLYNNKF